MEQAVATLRDEHGRIDTLVLNAGAGTPAALTDETPEHFDHLFRRNVRGPVLGLQAAARVMNKGGSVELVGSIAGAAGVLYFGTCAATKAALRSYARTWTAELAHLDIRVNVVSPGPTDTAKMAALPDEARPAMVAKIPLGRMARPEEVAATALFLTRRALLPVPNCVSMAA